MSNKNNPDKIVDKLLYQRSLSNSDYASLSLSLAGRSARNWLQRNTYLTDIFYAPVMVAGHFSVLYSGENGLINVCDAFSYSGLWVVASYFTMAGIEILARGISGETQLSQHEIGVFQPPRKELTDVINETTLQDDSKEYGPVESITQKY